MGLDCYPQPYDKNGCPIQGSNGMLHCDDESCPFDADRFPIGMLGTCCSLRGKVAAHELEALHETRLAEAMFEDMTPTQARDFAQELRCAADTLEQRHAGDAEKPKGAPWNGTYDSSKKEWVYLNHSTFEEALASIREAARWYEKVGRLGYGVHAWW